MQTYVAAADLGASSGRVLLACHDSASGALSIEEIHRFPNGFVHRNGHDCWDVETLLAQIEHGLEKIIARGIVPASVGIDTWGVDFVLLDAAGQLLGEAIAYRDPRTDGVPAQVFKALPWEALYARTGIQYMQINTLFQLVALTQANPQWLAHAHSLLLMADYLQYRLCGAKSCEYTNASTTQLVDIASGNWDYELIALLGLPPHWFQDLCQPGTRIGEWVSHSGECVALITPATHDTASAVLAIPLEDEGSVFISSGTWSLMGIESCRPYHDARAMSANFTNEGGVDNTFRVLKNIMGLWLIQRLLDAYPTTTFADLVQEAGAACPMACLINPNDARFLNPPSMREAIRNYCEETQQGTPKTIGEFARCIFESLAFSYRQTLAELSTITGQTFARIHIVGGGSRNSFLNQLCADFCRLPVLAGPAEASALGNITCQLRALGKLADRKAIRQLIRNQFAGEHALPRAQVSDLADLHWHRFLTLCAYSTPSFPE